jgi:hypothetical protein
VPVLAGDQPGERTGCGARDAGYAAGIASLAQSGVTVLGYVATTYGRRPEAAVRADIDTYRLWYPQATGIFFDEQSNKLGGEDYYRRLTTYARSKAFTFTVGNPGWTRRRATSGRST